MGWTTPATTTAGQLVTAAFWNQQVRDDLAYLHGDAGTATLGTGPFIIPGNLTVQAILSHGVAAQMRAHRHPYANDRHVESGTWVTSGGFGGGTFTDPYSTTPAVLAVPDGANDGGWYQTGQSSRSTAGFSLVNYNNSAARGGTWLSEGVD